MGADILCGCSFFFIVHIDNEILLYRPNYIVIYIFAISLSPENSVFMYSSPSSFQTYCWVNHLLFLGLFQSNSTVSCTLPKLGNKSSVFDLIIHRPWPIKTTIPAVAELGAVGMGQSEQFRPERGSWPPEAPLKEVLWTVWGSNLSDLLHRK